MIEKGPDHREGDQRGGEPEEGDPPLGRHRALAKGDRRTDDEGEQLGARAGEPRGDLGGGIALAQ